MKPAEIYLDVSQENKLFDEAGRNIYCGLQIKKCNSIFYQSNVI